MTANCLRRAVSFLVFAPLALNAQMQLVAITPCRVMDTRSATGTFGGPFIAGGSTRTVPIPLSSCGIPANAAAYSLNVTVAPLTGALGFLTVWPTGQGFSISTLNSPDGAIVANAAIVPAGSNGSINVFASDSTNLVLDIDGYFLPPGAGTLQFYPSPPCRVIDTRNANGVFGGPFIPAGTSRDFPIQTTCSVPATAQAYSLNVTAVPRPGKPLGFLTAWPTGMPLPGTSTLNTDTNVRANATIVQAGTPNGSVSFFANNDTDVVVDINGYFAPPGTGGLDFFPLTPCRVVDTRNTPNAPLAGPIMAGNTSRTFPAAGSCGLPSTAGAYSVSIAVVPSSFLGYLTTWPTGQTQPNVSTLNDPKGIVLANAALIPTGTSGSIDVFVLQQTHVIIDTNGYFR